MDYLPSLQKGSVWYLSEWTKLERKKKPGTYKINDKLSSANNK